MPENVDSTNIYTEKALETELPICDAHQHVWNFESSRYLVADFIKDASGGHNIKQSVAVQSRGNYKPLPGCGMTPVEETLFVMKQISGIKSTIDVAAGFVGYVDLEIGAAAQQLIEAHLEAGRKRFKGLRYPFEQHPDAGILTNSKVKEAFALLSKYKLTYELSISLPQYSEFIDMAKKYPDVPMIINHLGLTKVHNKTLEERNEIMAGWRQKIQLIAPIGNIYMKLGGTPRYFGFEKKSTLPTSEEIVNVVGPYYQSVIDQLGPKRCMFESNFPTDKTFSTYTVMWNAFKLMTKSYTKTERSFLFHDTANTVYNL